MAKVEVGVTGLVQHSMSGDYPHSGQEIWLGLLKLRALL
jgi:hypothetical protein